MGQTCISHLVLTVCGGKRLLQSVQVSCIVWLSSVAYDISVSQKKVKNKYNLVLQLSVKSFTNI